MYIHVPGTIEMEWVDMAFQFSATLKNKPRVVVLYTQQWASLKDMHWTFICKSQTVTLYFRQTAFAQTLHIHQQNQGQKGTGSQLYNDLAFFDS